MSQRARRTRVPGQCRFGSVAGFSNAASSFVGPRTAGGTRYPCTQAFGHNKQERDQKNSEYRCGDHAAKHGCSYGVTCGRPGAPRNDQGEKPKDERKTCHHHRTKSQSCPGNSSSINVFAEPSLLDGKCNNQNSVFGS